MILETPRLILRPFEERDRAPFAALNADPEVMAHFPAVLDRAASDALVGRIAERRARMGLAFGVAERRQDGAMLGMVGLMHVIGPGFPFEPTVEIGWRFARQHWGQGYVTEAGRALLDFGFDGLGLGSVVAFTVPGNRRSRAVMERLGMRHELSGDFDHPHVPVGHPLRRHVLYRLDAADWRAAAVSAR